MEVIVRDLNKHDFSKGFLECLKNLTTVGDISIEDAEKRFELIHFRNYRWFINF